ncbi:MULTISPECIES: hypothetical protein [Haloferax]|uniref:hypothetical protein n=1 Tax=Haloferax TaxID=2251 RepID=UPI001CD9E970|nr:MULTISPECIES: hypothetical protein [Haloferax]
MGRRDTLEADVFQPLWAAGWQWVWIVAGGLFLGGYLILEFGDVLQGGGIIAGGLPSQHSASGTSTPTPTRFSSRVSRWDSPPSSTSPV